MVLTLCLMGALLADGQAQPRSQKFLNDLLRQRGEFETVLKEPKEYIGYTHVGSEMLGGAHGDALYPLGSASERYIVSYYEANQGGVLVYEKRHGRTASVVWHVGFGPPKKKSPAKGTVPLFLQRLGFAIDRKAHLTAGMRRQLSANCSFASYSFHPMMGGYACVVKPDGSCTTTRKSNDTFTITPEEKHLLLRRSVAIGH